MSEDLSEFPIKKEKQTNKQNQTRVSGKQTGFAGAEPKGAGSPDSESLYASLLSLPPNLLNPQSAD